MNYEDYIVSHKEFVGFNLDATTADRLYIERVESAQPCKWCRFEQTSNLNPHDPMVFSVINPVYCPYNVVKINGVVYKRNRIFDENLDHTVKKEERCPGCGVPVGFIHHVDCKYDVCPGCESSYCSYSYVYSY